MSILSQLVFLGANKGTNQYKPEQPEQLICLLCTFYFDDFDFQCLHHGYVSVEKATVYLLI